MPKHEPIKKITQLSDIEPMLSLRDIAQIMGLSLRTVSTWRAEGYLCKPDLTHGRTVRWKRDTIKNWLDEQSAQAQ